MRSVAVVAFLAASALPADSGAAPSRVHVVASGRDATPAALFDLAACATELAPVTPAAPTIAPAPTTSAGGETLAPPRQLVAFAHVDAGERARAGAAIAKHLAFLHARVELDASGMAREVEIWVAGTRADVLDKPALDFVRAHPCLFGVTDRAHLGAHVSVDQVIIDAPHAVGSVVAAVETSGAGTRLRFSGHFWPVANHPLDVTAEHLRRFLGRAANPSIRAMRRTAGAPDAMVGRATVAELDLGTDAGPVLTCTPDRFEVTPAIFVTLRGLPGDDPVLAELPAPVDPATGRALGGAWIMPTRGEPYTTWTPPDRASDAGRTCLGTEP